MNEFENHGDHFTARVARFARLMACLSAFAALFPVATSSGAERGAPHDPSPRDSAGAPGGSSPHSAVARTPGISPAYTFPAPWAEALRAIGWEPSDLHFDTLDRDRYGGGGQRTHLFDSWIGRPYLIPGDLARIETAALENGNRPARLSAQAAAWADQAVRRGLISDPAAELDKRLPRSEPVLYSLGRIWDAAGESFGPAERTRARRALAGMPAAWHRPLARLLLAEADAMVWRRDALAAIRPLPGLGAHPEPEPAAQDHALSGTGHRPALHPSLWSRLHGDGKTGPEAEARDARPADRWLSEEGFHYVAGLDEDEPDPGFYRGVEAAALQADLPLIQAGTMDLLFTIEAVLPLLQELRPTPLQEPSPTSPQESSEPPERGGPRLPDASPGPWSLETPLGRLAIGSWGPDRHEDDDYLLLLDPAGNDVYAGGGAGHPGCPVSILIDLRGDDRYATSDSTRPAFGAGVAGIGVLADLEGDDVYRSVHLSQGAAFCGFGLLWDRAGNDRYDAFTSSQGAGFFGVGLLVDEDGDDRYHAYQQTQGYGYTRGAGLLLDVRGNDEYVADDTDIRFPSSQSPEHNSSLAQGFGFGKRADYLDGHSLAGGVGMLIDGSGDDRYRCGIFGQGAAYWYGVGVLADRSGDDEYEGVWYTQASAAHFALGILMEGGGNDRYRSTHNMAQGAGHDFSLGFLYERGGNDVYEAPNLSLGGGNANGFGIFWDVRGDDRYQVSAATTLGRSNVAAPRGGPRDRMKNLGLFLDTGGTDVYPESKAFAGNGRTWTQPGLNTDPALRTEWGVGMDTEWEAETAEEPDQEPTQRTSPR